MVFGSKKATITVYGLLLILIVIVAVKLAVPSVSDEDLQNLIALLAAVVGSYNIGQGIADHGKVRPPSEIIIGVEESEA